MCQKKMQTNVRMKIMREHLLHMKATTLNQQMDLLMTKNLLTGMLAWPLNQMQHHLKEMSRLKIHHY